MKPERRGERPVSGSQGRGLARLGLCCKIVAGEVRVKVLPLALVTRGVTGDFFFLIYSALVGIELCDLEQVI